jgi:hypothetical protein
MSEQRPATGKTQPLVDAKTYEADLAILTEELPFNGDRCQEANRRLSAFVNQIKSRRKPNVGIHWYGYSATPF